MKIYILSLSIIIAIASCVPPGKLTEAIEANNAISKKYDSIQIKLTDTITNFSSSLNELKTNLKYLWDDILSVHPSTKMIFLKNKCFDISCRVGNWYGNI